MGDRGEGGYRGVHCGQLLFEGTSTANGSHFNCVPYTVQLCESRSSPGELLTVRGWGGFRVLDPEGQAEGSVAAHFL